MQYFIRNFGVRQGALAPRRLAGTMVGLQNRAGPPLILGLTVPMSIDLHFCYDTVRYLHGPF